MINKKLKTRVEKQKAMWNQGTFPNPTYLKFSNNGCQNFQNQCGDNSLIEDHLESQAGRISL